MKVYKIRNKDGLFSSGGMRPRWVKQGKVWQQLGHVHSHIQQLTTNYTPADIYKDADVVEAEITESLTTLEPAKDWLIRTYNEQSDHYRTYLDRPGYEWAEQRLNEISARKSQLL